VVNIVAQVSQETGKILGKPVITTHGIVSNREMKKFNGDIELLLETLLLAMKPEALKDHKAIENETRNVVRKHIVKFKKRYPLIIPIVFIV